MRPTCPRSPRMRFPAPSSNLFRRPVDDVNPQRRAQYDAYIDIVK